jgi:hypothetical protein
MTEHIDETETESIANQAHLIGDHERVLGADEKWRGEDEPSGYEY